MIAQTTPVVLKLLISHVCISYSGIEKPRKALTHSLSLSLSLSLTHTHTHTHTFINENTAEIKKSMSWRVTSVGNRGSEPVFRSTPR